MQDPAKEFYAMQCFLFQSPVPVSFTGFVDDLAYKSIGHLPMSAVDAKARLNRITAQRLKDIGIGLNDDKESVIDGPDRAATKWIRTQIANPTDDAVVPPTSPRPSAPRARS